MKNTRFALLTFLLGMILLTLSPNTADAQSRTERKERTTRKAEKKNARKQSTAARNSNRQSNRQVNRQPNRQVNRRERTVAVVPTQARAINYRNVNYRYRNGIFYRPQGSAFIVARPPIGIRISILPPARRIIRIAGRPIYYYDGIYYNPVANNEFEVIQPPMGARLTQIPPYGEIVYLDGQEYYLSEGTYYRSVQEPDGTLAYEVAGYM